MDGGSSVDFIRSRISCERNRVYFGLLNNVAAIQSESRMLVDIPQPMASNESTNLIKARGARCHASLLKHRKCMIPHP